MAELPHRAVRPDVLVYGSLMHPDAPQIDQCPVTNYPTWPEFIAMSCNTCKNHAISSRYRKQPNIKRLRHRRHYSPFNKLCNTFHNVGLITHLNRIMKRMDALVARYVREKCPKILRNRAYRPIIENSKTSNFEFGGPSFNFGRAILPEKGMVL